MSTQEDYYGILGVSPDVNSDQIKEAYLYKVNILHPDRLIAMGERIRRLAFGKPLLQEICWSFGVSDDEAFMTGGGLLDADSNPKQSYFALKNLIKSWTTSGTGVTNEKGEFELRGFAGDYDITLTSPDGHSCKTKIHISEQECTELTIEFKPTNP
ncbi:hypothetical protein ES703_73886 [subsurface metagenome]